MKLNSTAFAFALIAGTTFGVSATAQSPVTVHDPWARATAPGQTSGAVYLSLMSPAGDTLTGVSSPDAGATMLHKTTHMGNMSGMADMDTLALPPGKTVTFAPHGMHIMLMDLKHPLTQGQTVEVDLTFAKSGVVHVKAPVQPLAASGPPA